MSRTNTSYQDTLLVQTAMKTWLNTCPVKPVAIAYDSLPRDGVGVTITDSQTVLKTKQFVYGGYEAKYDFKLVYRVQPTDDTDQTDAINSLNEIGAWAEQSNTKPSLGSKAKSIKVKRTGNASLMSVYEDGTFDYAIELTMTWEVI